MGEVQACWISICHEKLSRVVLSENFTEGYLSCNNLFPIIIFSEQFPKILCAVAKLFKGEIFVTEKALQETDEQICVSGEEVEFDYKMVDLIFNFKIIPHFKQYVQESRLGIVDLVIKNVHKCKIGDCGIFEL